MVTGFEDDMLRTNKALVVAISNLSEVIKDLKDEVHELKSELEVANSRSVTLRGFG